MVPPVHAPKRTATPLKQSPLIRCLCLIGEFLVAAAIVSGQSRTSPVVYNNEEPAGLLWTSVADHSCGTVRMGIDSALHSG